MQVTCDVGLNVCVRFPWSLVLTDSGGQWHPKNTYGCLARPEIGAEKMFIQSTCETAVTLSDDFRLGLKVRGAYINLHVTASWWKPPSCEMCESPISKTRRKPVEATCSNFWPKRGCFKGLFEGQPMEHHLFCGVLYFDARACALWAG